MSMFNENEVFLFLDDLRESGQTNMFGAGYYLQSQFGMNKKEAREWLLKWMKVFGSRKEGEAES